MILPILWRILLLGLTSVSSESGTFWQITDIHYDGNYSVSGLVTSMCHNSSADGQKPGMYGDYLCDSPRALMLSAINAMKTINSKPDFILWTGDSIPHVPDNTRNYEQVFTNIDAISKQLMKTFPGVAIFPTIGNHDAWPANQVPDGPNPYYEQLLTNASWQDMLPYYSQDWFRQGGYYVSEIGRDFLHIGLNTILWYVNDNKTRSEKDPSNHIGWLLERLSEAEKHGQKVLLSGHVPLGELEHPGISGNISSQLLPLLTRFRHIITAMIFGHEHRDQFRILYTEGVPSIPIFLSTSVTPLTASLLIGANNPAIRLYTYDRDTGHILDYQQYYLNLTAANIEKKAEWKLDYTFTKEYEKPDASAASLHRTVHSFQADPSPAFDKYIRHFAASYVPVLPCEELCKKIHICSITQLDYAKRDRCINGDVGSTGQSNHMPPPTHHHPLPPPVVEQNSHPHPHPVPRYMYALIYSVVALMLFSITGLTVYCCCREPRKTSASQPRYVLIS